MDTKANEFLAKKICEIDYMVVNNIGYQPGPTIL